MMRYPTCFKAPRRAALSASLSAALGLVCASAPPVPLLAAQQTQTFTAPRPTVTANDHLVMNCLDDNSPGTLRTVLADPTVVSGDSINLSQLTCSTITLGAPLR